jgi:N-hydroxyarylamine O-acetyltransferase
MSMDRMAYLRRINYHGSLDPTAATLRALHRAHLLAVPFENLDIHLGRPIVLDEAALFEKIVVRRRGGFCYELNGLFASLLRELGFDVTMLSAGVARAEGGFGPEFDHMTLAVRAPGAAQPWLADVGFGDSFRAPLLLDGTGEQIQDGRAYQLDSDGAAVTLMQRDGETWEAQYRFTLQPHAHAEYARMCHYHQTSPQSSFTRKRVCSLATPEGRLTLSDRLLIVSERDARTERMLADEQEYRVVLRDYFGVDLTLG